MPKSLIGQMAMLIGVALLVAQLVNFALILNERQKLSLAQIEGPAIARFTAVAADIVQAPPRDRALIVEEGSRRVVRFDLGRESRVREQGRDEDTEARLRQSLVGAGLQIAEVRAASSTEMPLAGRFPSLGRGSGREPPVQMLSLSARFPTGEWLNGRFITPRPDPWLTARLAAATLILYIIVLGATILIASRLARPLRDLTRAAEQFGGRHAPLPVEPRGPADLRRAIEAFNAMNGRVLALLDEKDRMLGAIGHDLRTPLASLRIRAENVEPESERERVVATIDEMADMLEDILVLARSGRAREDERPMDVAALVDALVEEYRERGEEVSLASAGRQVLSVQPTLLRRAVRNLIDNALKYAGPAKVSVRREADELVIEVADEGPGLPPEQLDQVLEPFYRVEESRSRDTGGAGLGLAISKAVAESHGGALRLANAWGGGLIATLRLPHRAS